MATYWNLLAHPSPAPAIEGKVEDQKPAMEQLYRFVYAGERQPKEIGKRYGVIFWNGKYGEAVSMAVIIGLKRIRELSILQNLPG